MKSYTWLHSPGRRVVVTAVLFLGSLVVGPSLAAAEVPAGLVAFFNAKACPTSGWKIADYASGRLIVAVTDGATVGIRVGTPLANAENPKHKHAYKGNVHVKYKGVFFLGKARDSNKEALSSGLHAYKGTTLAAASGLPFIQFPICEKM